MPTIRPFAVKEKRAMRGWGGFRGQAPCFPLNSHSFLLCGLEWFVQRLSVLGVLSLGKGAGQVCSISSIVFLVCILILEIYRIFWYFFLSCFEMLHVHSFVTNGMGLTSRLSECNIVVPLQLLWVINSNQGCKCLNGGFLCLSLFTLGRNLLMEGGAEVAIPCVTWLRFSGMTYT